MNKHCGLDEYLLALGKAQMQRPITLQLENCLKFEFQTARKWFVICKCDFCYSQIDHVWFNDEAFKKLPSKDYGVTFEFRRSPDANKNVERVVMKIEVCSALLNPN